MKTKEGNINKADVAFFVVTKKKKKQCVTILALGLRPRQKGCKFTGQDGGSRVTSHAPRSAKNAKSEGMNPHTPN
jgi:hypothetical protein